MKLYGVYHANGGIPENSPTSLVKFLGQTHCALCDITHGMVRTKEAFKECQRQTPVAFTNLHLNEQPDALKTFTTNQTPCVVLEKEGYFFMALDKQALENCRGDVGLFQERLNNFLKAHL